MKKICMAILCTVVTLPLFGSDQLDKNKPTGALFNVLVFSKTNAFRHSSIRNGIAAIRQLGADNNFSVDATEDSNWFTDDNLANYDVVVFLNTTSPPDRSRPLLNDDQRAAFTGFIQAGGGFVGIHSASDTEYDWPWYGQLVGAYFRNHPPGIHQATIHVVDPNHPSTASLPEEWTRTDEWYNFRANPRDNVHVLATLDEGTYKGGEMGDDHPISWCHDFDGGRAWYTAMGHTEASYGELEYRAHILGGIQTAAGVKDADCSVKTDRPYERIDSEGKRRKLME